MKIYKESIVGVAAVLLLAMAAPVAMASGEECCNDPNSQHAEKIDTSVTVNDLDTILMKLSVLETSDVANDGRILLGGTVDERTVKLAAWYFDRNGESDISAEALSLTVKDAAGNTVDVGAITKPAATDTKPVDGFLPVHYQFTLPADLEAGVYSIEVPNGNDNFVTKFQLYETIHWEVDATDGVRFGNIDPTAVNVESTAFSITNRATSAFNVAIHMKDLQLVDAQGNIVTGSEAASIAVANNVDILTSDDGATYVKAQTVDTTGKAGDAATIATTEDAEGNLVAKTLHFKLELLDATPGDNANSILPAGVYQSTFCVLVTASGTGDFAYTEGQGQFDYDGNAPTTSHDIVDANGANGPDGKGKVTPPSDY